MALQEKVYSSKRKLLGRFGVLASSSLTKYKAVLSSLQLGSMVSEFTSMMGVATLEGQGGFHTMETFWDCLLVVVIILQDKEDMDNSSHNKDQSMLEVVWILALVGAVSTS